MALKFMYITNKPEVAVIAQKYGVDRIWIDLEVLGKNERQKNMNTVKSNHSIDDIKAIKSVIDSSEILVRINPWNDNSQNEIQQVIEAGADIIMLPMWKTVEEVKQFIKAIDKRTKTVLLLETKEAVDCIDEVLLIEGIDEIHIGLNDLHLSYGLTFMFELLSNGTVEMLCNKIKEFNIPYGFGGIARIGEGALPAEKVIIEHYRLGSTRAILSRSFCNAEEINDINQIEQVFEKNMLQIREFEKSINLENQERIMLNKKDILDSVNHIIASKKR